MGSCIKTNKIDKHVITIDVDWISDFVISEVADILIKKRTKATWFITHDSDATRALFDRPDLFEVGLHPNFFKGSTQGSNPREMMKNLKTIAPNAVSVRTHRLIQSTELLWMMAEEFRIHNDVSLLLPRVTDLTPHRMYFNKDLYLTRLPYFWQDDLETLHPKPSYSLEDEFHHEPGLKIYGFHPIHIVLNTFDLSNYRQLKAHGDILTCTPHDIEKYTNKRVGDGIGVFFKELVCHVSGGYTIEDIVREWDEEVVEND